MYQRKKIMMYLFLILPAALLLCSFTTFRQETGKGSANVVPARTPVGKNSGRTIWTRSFAASGGRYTFSSDPVICGSVLYIANGRTLYQLDKKKGTILRSMQLSAQTNAICHMLLEGNLLMIPLAGGKIECVDTRSMTSRWKSRAFGGQSLSTLYYKNGFLYAGTTVMTSGTGCTGIFYCINTKNGSTQWTYEDKSNPGGYYGSGAVSQGGRLYFAGDNGVLVSHSLTENTVYDTVPLTEKANIRTGLTYDPDTASLYTADTEGIIYRIPVSGNGKIQKGNIRFSPVVPDARSIHCTSTPAICRGRLYIGCIADGYGCLSVMDARNLRLHYKAKGAKAAEIKSSPLVSTGYSSKKNNNRVYVYVSANNLPGGIYYLTDDSTSVRGTLQTLYIPKAAQQYCMSSITADKEGNLYYSNDSNTLFAVSAFKPKKPSKIRIKKKKQSITVSWKKTIKKSQTMLYLKYGKGKWTKKIIKTKTKYKLSRKRKTLRLRFRCRMCQNKKWIYSGYTKTYKIKYH